MMPIGSTFLLKYHVSFNFMLIITLQFHCDNLRKLWISFLTYLGQTKIWKFVRLCDLYNWMNQSSFEGTLLDNLLINGHYLKNTKMRFSLKTAVFTGMIFIWPSLSMNQLLEKIYFELPHALNFSYFWHKEASYCR